MTVYVLKIIAVVSMLIDHIGAVLFPELTVLRMIGRMAFPIYCFLIGEGLVHTRSLPKYFLRLAVFALLSEIPYDLAFRSCVLEFTRQNVFITLLLGLAAISADRYTEHLPRPAALLCSLGALAACAAAAEVLNCDYGWYGVALIWVFYVCRDKRAFGMLGFALLTLCCYTIKTAPLAGLQGYGIERFKDEYTLLSLSVGDTLYYFSTATQTLCLLTILPLSLYNGERGRGGFKYIFYAFYPAHLLVLWLVKLFG